MRYLQIPGSPKPISQLILGSDYYRPEIIDDISVLLDAYMALGGNTIDTAHIYAGGQSEVALGMWMSSRNNRDDVVIFTKGAHPDASGARVTKEAIDHDLQCSLERLQTDYIDLYGLHRDDETKHVGEIIEALNAHIDAGRIRAIGGSNWSCQRLQEANRYADENGLIGFSFSSPNLSLAKANEPFWTGCVSADEAACAWHEEHSFPLFSWSSQARGFFTGRFTPEVRDNADLVRVFYSDDNWERLNRATILAQELGATTIQVALAYVLNQPFPTSALIGPQNIQELESCFSATKITLDEATMRWLDLREATRA